MILRNSKIKLIILFSLFFLTNVYANNITNYIMPFKAFEGLEELDVDLVIEDTNNLTGMLKTMIGDTFTEKGIVSVANIAYWINEGPFLDVKLFQYQDKASIKAEITAFDKNEIATKIDSDADMTFKLESEYGNSFVFFVDEIRFTVISFSNEIDTIAFGNTYVKWVKNYKNID